jgi:hypothetical protein
MTEQDIEFEQDLEDDIDEFDGKPQIFTDKSDPEVESLVNRINRGSIILQPDFQRYYVWDEIKASKLIESALLSIPLPTIYLSEEKDGKIYVIDGQQRLTSFVSFVSGKFPNGQQFRLKKLKVLKDFDDKLFSELPAEIQDRILQFTIRTITFLRQSGSDLKFEIFERLNTGSVALNDQELRNCIYRGRYNELLRELANNSEFRYLLNISTPDNRMADVELVLRFASFYHSTYLKYKPPIKKFLNNDMEKYQNISKVEADNLCEAFKNALQIIRSLFDKNAFKRFYMGSENNSKDGYWEPKKFNHSLYDVLMGVLCTVDRNIAFQNLDKIREGFIDLMASDTEYIDAIQRSTSSIQAVTLRFDKTRAMIQSIIGINSHEPRLFSFQIKDGLFKQNQICAI